MEFIIIFVLIAIAFTSLIDIDNVESQKQDNKKQE